MPGSRKFEIENMLPMFVRIALQIRRRLPDVPIGIARSPFTTDEELARALAAGGVREAYGYPARLEAGGAAILAGGERFPLLAAAMRAARHARLAVAIPGTKLIELAALGIPSIATMPLNRPELIVINGVLQYVGRLPLVGVPAKRAAIAAGHKRFRFVAQPNIDAERELIPEIRGTLLPSHVAHVAAERFADAEWLAQTGAALRALYAGHAGVAGRMAGVLLEDAAR
jgi:lipid-A-disaccharide synthase